MGHVYLIEIEKGFFIGIEIILEKDAWQVSRA